ncbi:MarR family winged helix-turn-helix transcriptional regulator [Carboxydothermus pertinax]|uniref:MarR family transcriptional regulator n=1 Tax=Carboxydothermus pertinax TaxID=870242 RepID=A0A1L8CSF0_9THEO|nr:MarR family transcriptional regulator [Carboxydothermus pertinax]GAV21842.1 MarR family transcriptional regulator [Carboxydothermus pertinax]
MDTNNVISLISSIREKANRFIMRELNNRGIKGIVTSHGDILVALFKNNVLTMKEIAEKIDRDKSTVTALVDKLVDFGYVKKERDPADSRVILVSLTDLGKQLQPDFEDISRKLIDVAFRGISPEEREALVKILIKIKENF